MGIRVVAYGGGQGGVADFGRRVEEVTDWRRLAADLLFGTPEVRDVLEEKPLPVAGRWLLVKPDSSVRPPARFATRSLRLVPTTPHAAPPSYNAPHGIPRIGGGTWAIVIGGLVLMGLSPELEKWLRLQAVTSDPQPTTIPITAAPLSPGESLPEMWERITRESKLAIRIAELREQIARLKQEGRESEVSQLRQELEGLRRMAGFGDTDPERRLPSSHPSGRVSIINNADNADSTGGSGSPGVVSTDMPEIPGAGSGTADTKEPEATNAKGPEATNIIAPEAANAGGAAESNLKQWEIEVIKLASLIFPPEWEMISESNMARWASENDLGHFVDRPTWVAADFKNGMVRQGATREEALAALIEGLGEFLWDVTENPGSYGLQEQFGYEHRSRKELGDQVSAKINETIRIAAEVSFMVQLTPIVSTGTSFCYKVADPQGRQYWLTVTPAILRFSVPMMDLRRIISDGPPLAEPPPGRGLSPETRATLAEMEALGDVRPGSVCPAGANGAFAALRPGDSSSGQW